MGDFLALLFDNLDSNANTLAACVGGIAAGFGIILDRPFQIGGFTGMVECIGLKTARIRSLGRDILVFSSAGFTKSRSRNFKRMNERRITFKSGESGLQFAADGIAFARPTRMLILDQREPSPAALARQPA